MLRELSTNNAREEFATADIDVVFVNPNFSTNISGSIISKEKQLYLGVRKSYKIRPSWLQEQPVVSLALRPERRVIEERLNSYRVVIGVTCSRSSLV